jgi:oxygen-dependent protoporphyrinogen oxidase
MFPGRAPEGHVAFSVYIGGSRDGDSACLPADDLIALARWDLKDLLGARGAPLVARVRHWSRGLPQMTRGHRSRIAAISNMKDQIPGLFLTGNYFEGPGVAACVARAKKTAEQVSEFLGRQRLKKFDQGGAEAASTLAMSPSG